MEFSARTRSKESYQTVATLKLSLLLYLSNSARSFISSNILGYSNEVSVFLRFEAFIKKIENSWKCIELQTILWHRHRIIESRHIVFIPLTSLCSLSLLHKFVVKAFNSLGHSGSPATVSSSTHCGTGSSSHSGRGVPNDPSVGRA